MAPDTVTTDDVTKYGLDFTVKVTYVRRFCKNNDGANIQLKLSGERVRQGIHA